jgi:hypothetical protein
MGKHEAWYGMEDEQTVCSQVHTEPGAVARSDDAWYFEQSTVSKTCDRAGQALWYDRSWAQSKLACWWVRP